MGIAFNVPCILFNVGIYLGIKSKEILNDFIFRSIVVFQKFSKFHMIVLSTKGFVLIFVDFAMFRVTYFGFYVLQQDIFDFFIFDITLCAVSQVGSI